MAQRAWAYKADAVKAPDNLSPERKAELQQLASDARAWHAETGQNDILVTDERVATGRRADEAAILSRSRVAPRKTKAT